MPKIFIAILLMLYTASSTGASLYAHYCMNEKIDTGLFINNQKTCGGCGMDKTENNGMDCCDDEHELLKVDDDQLASVGIELSKVTYFLAAFNFINSSLLDKAPVYNSNTTDSFTLPNIALHKKWCVFLI